MTEINNKRDVAYRVASHAFFRADLFTSCYDKDFTMDFPTAPPGMPDHYETWEAECCFSWLNRTVRKWDVELKEFYKAKDQDLFWAIGNCDADVHWGDHDGRFISMFVLTIKVNDDHKITHLCWRTDPCKMLVAAGRKMPDFNVEDVLNDGIVKSFKGYHSLFDPEYDPICYPTGNDEVDIKKRIEMILAQHSCGIERNRYRNLPEKKELFAGFASFIPEQQMKASEKYGEEKVFSWVKLSSPWMYRDPRNKVYGTDDPHVYFAEMNCLGPGCWYGIKGETGHYHQNYLVYIRIDDQGYLTSWIEILNSINIMNSSNVDCGSFPYYY